MFKTLKPLKSQLALFQFLTFCKKNKTCLQSFFQTRPRPRTVLGAMSYRLVSVVRITLIYIP